MSCEDLATRLNAVILNNLGPLNLTERNAPTIQTLKALILRLIIKKVIDPDEYLEETAKLCTKAIDNTKRHQDKDDFTLPIRADPDEEEKREDASKIGRSMEIEPTKVKNKNDKDRGNKKSKKSSNRNKKKDQRKKNEAGSEDKKSGKKKSKNTQMEDDEYINSFIDIMRSNDVIYKELRKFLKAKKLKNRRSERIFNILNVIILIILAIVWRDETWVWLSFAFSVIPYTYNFILEIKFKSPKVVQTLTALGLFSGIGYLSK